MNKTLHARHALLPEGWARDVRITIAGDRITAIATGVAPVAGDQLTDHLVPAMCNLHSHAFQRAFSGLTELRGNPTDNFWTWRDIMYKFALNVSPDDLQAIGAQLYMEMIEAGYARVGEFHYVHHDPAGQHYARVSEMAQQLFAAARHTGLRMTMLPSFYAHAGFGGLDPVPGQVRFINDLDSFARIVDECRATAATIPGALVGVAPHSLRAVTGPELEAVVAIAGDAPIHIHVSEQTREVEDSIAFSGKRPVEWLLDHAPVDARWCLIHATHLVPDEIVRLQATGATVGLCPITEANLGDGIFPGHAFMNEGAGGHVGVGSDSNVRISVSQELSQLEYSQRLGLRQRNVLAAGSGSTGQRLFDAAIAGGARALGVDAGIRLGAEASLTALDTSGAPWLREAHALDGWIFGHGVAVDRVWVGGECLVEGGRHRARDIISARFAQVMTGLTDRLQG